MAYGNGFFNEFFYSGIPNRIYLPGQCVWLGTPYVYGVIFFFLRADFAYKFDLRFWIPSELVLLWCDFSSLVHRPSTDNFSAGHVAPNFQGGPFSKSVLDLVRRSFIIIFFFINRNGIVQVWFYHYSPWLKRTVVTIDFQLDNPPPVSFGFENNNIFF